MDVVRGSRGERARRRRTRVRSWTGRAATSCSTSSTVPSFVTAGTHRTRVSEMRLNRRTDSLRLDAVRPKGVLDRWMVSNIARIVLASATMIPVVLLLRSKPLGLQVVAGAAAYVAASLMLRTVGIHEVQGLVQGLRRGRRPGAVAATEEPTDPAALR